MTDSEFIKKFSATIRMVTANQLLGKALPLAEGGNASALEKVLRRELRDLGYTKIISLAEEVI